MSDNHRCHKISGKVEQVNKSQYKNNITINIYNNIKEKYGYISSFAIWHNQINQKNRSGMEDILFFENINDDLLKKLNTNFVIVGLNISKKIPRCFGNFHSNYKYSNDYKIRYALENTIFWGSYMTDIIKDFEEKISGEIVKYLNAGSVAQWLLYFYKIIKV